MPRRANYGHASLPLASHAGKALIESFYGQKPRHSYFYGCSKGGQEGMAFAQRHLDEFDGIVAAAPGFALPRAALNRPRVSSNSVLWPGCNWGGHTFFDCGHPALLTSI
jgi:alpha-beta hydrolase superfamily lysophospholipase